MTKIHMISRNPLHLTALTPPVHESGFWTFYEAEANKLVNGKLYLHKTKAEPSYFGGTIIGYRLAEAGEPYPGKILFKVSEEEACKGIGWEGDKHPMAWMGGILDD
ncbi:hypothetical protein [Beijerinckia indica]|uniref:Uncharacterized protein n=1 Tax=Beijerinckia indica subsp. indica (strain ATCC 9039 / DSM 1715 / NCIMB 8712) TaxID=395963 RepID=B2IJK5_BEII9|nr:hypothetical protein [Beijerinckia indica]ACB94879.1 conserved hypothetical protein [Beijerinckia indica subsp. indica ATCC 9039]